MSLTGWEATIVLVLVVLVVGLLGIVVLTRDPRRHETRVGFFVERDELTHKRRRGMSEVSDLPGGDEPGEPEKPEEGEEDSGEPGTEEDEDEAS